MPAKEGRSRLATRCISPECEDRSQVAVEVTTIRRGYRDITSAIMLFDRVVHRLDREVVRRDHRDLGSFLTDFAHHTVDVLQLVERFPTRVLATPVEVGRQPHRKGFREVLVRMLLCVPAEDVSHVGAREWIGAVALAVWP